MNYFDIFTIVTTIGLAVVGFREGLVRGIIKLVGFFVLAAVMVLNADRIVAVGRALPLLPDTVWVTLAFIVPFILGLVALNYVAGAIHQVIQMTPAGFIDNGLGTLFGLVQAVLVTGLVAAAFSHAHEGSAIRTQYEESRTGPYVRGIVLGVIPFLDKGIHNLDLEPPTPLDVPHDENDRDNPPA